MNMISFQKNQKQTSPRIFSGRKSNQPAIHSLIKKHKKQKSSSILERKPQLAIMKWNGFLEQYHMLKQLININNSINAVGLRLQKKKQKFTGIKNVPYIQSEQISVSQHVQQECETRQQVHQSHKSQNNIKIKSKSSSNEHDEKIIGKTQKQPISQKLIISIRINQQQQQVQNKVTNKLQNESNQNFTDQQDNMFDSEHKQKMLSTNKNSKTNNHIDLSITESKQMQKITSNTQDEPEQVSQYMRKTACFSFCQTQSNCKQSIMQGQNNQENFNHMNKQTKSKKVQVLLKLQSQQQNRRRKAQKIIEQDRQYLNKIIRNSKK